MSTQKDLIHYHLFHYIAQRADYLAKQTGFPVPSVRRVLGELVAAGKAKSGKDIFGYPGYMATRRARRAS